MKAFRRLKSLWHSDRGNVIAIGAATLPLLMGSAGFAIDTVQMAMWERQLQRAADSAALAGAHAMVQGASADPAVANDVDEHIDYDLEENEKPMLIEGSPVVTTGSFADGSLSATQECADRGVSPCWDRAVEVSLTAERRLPFMGMFTRASTQLTATAAAAIVADGDFCLISLYDGTETGISTGGNANLSLGCGMATNSRGNPAFRNYGSATVLADPVAAVGSIGGNAGFADGTTLMPYASPVDDPFADVPDPTVPDGESCDTALSVGVNDTVTLDPDTDLTCYTSWDIKGTLTLEPGTYYVNDGLLDLSSQGSITGDDVTIVFMGDDSDFKHNGQATLDISAPDEGDYAGIAMYRDRNAEVIEFKINGGSNTFIDGAIYMASGDVSVLGNAGITSTCLQIVSRKIDFKGGGAIDNSCPNNEVRSITYNTVRLVG